MTALSATGITAELAFYDANDQKIGDTIMTWNYRGISDIPADRVPEGTRTVAIHEHSRVSFVPWPEVKP